MEITKLTAIELSKKIKQKELSVEEAVKATFSAIKKREPYYHSYITVNEEEALEQASKIQIAIEAGKFADSPLAGVPIAIKDNICVKGMRTTCASKILEDFIPPYNASVIERLKDAGAIILGKTNMDEFAMGSTTETSYFGATKNPWNIECIPGGSSGGSAAAVAAEEAFIALGTDTGGSIRQPSAFCGVTGIKPTYGTVSRYGLVAYASSLDQIGPIARSVSDCAATLQVISGADDKDSTCVKAASYDYVSALRSDVRGLRIGIPRGYFSEGLDAEVKKHVLEAAAFFKEQGAIVEEFDLEAVDYATPAYYVIASAEASSNLSRYDGVKYGYRTADFDGLQELYKKTRSEGFGEEVKRRMMIGSFVLSSGYYDAYYNKALKVRALIKQSFDRAFERFDIILGPTTPAAARKLGQSLFNPVKMFLGDIYTVSVNLAGLPAISLPCGLSEESSSDKSAGMPIGLQLIGKPFGEKDIIRAAYTLEQTKIYQRPKLID
ncbi:Asp-tRNA(Asn)/Glu-tRNA(Gln) amidotransferase subunit GatA [Lachnoclostridium phytofermentans]|uniref:Glutamyl-tRNA(Gln) amidotransferase subunit A n=1 Tax=Lachnoclostridium phytofermentans (strain ATCC 700394 / DSM 18823 / ISDg) TaxID=357809 RepID=GATA_LACP7|nr:Asp-tRNA(Asn)/Glu-tRNA(Gln) amidotransferase subunit GatA [Lachnoclostridium phytofermentans]A9KJ26.1 RecName: Full=Glutamyl-tRNA(Gln) amidotransferase subunit A; Short=Glu-ADT subunit A [Lachnoclostridium phytofermentans ISDg]ABX41025.1 glutamyl-tRNA(Gln) amidotransferase, A subunit [Lachnoclostridium phytofermentans ISDg]